MTLITYLSVIESHGLLSLIFPFDLFSQDWQYFDAYTIGLVSHEKVEPEGQFQGKNGAFLNRFTRKNQFLFHESKLSWHPVPKKYSQSTLRETSNPENCPFFGQTPYNFDLS